MAKLFQGFMSNEAVEELASKRLREYEQVIGKPVAFPVPVEEVIEQTLDLAGFRAAIADAKAHLAAVEPAHFEGREQEPLTVKLGEIMEPTLPAGQWMSVFATTNIYFHLSIAYAILRAKGVPIGKADLFAGRI